MDMNIYKRIASLSIQQREQLILRLGLKNENSEPQKNSGKCLCAYIVARPGQTIDTSELRNYLSGKLPEYMIPAHFVFLPGLPLTPHGKIDIKALPAHPPQAQQEGSYTAPGNDLEMLIADVWKEVLSLEKVSVNDSFFEIGGNSLKLLRLHNRLKEAFQRDIPILKMFEHPTVKSLSGYMSSQVGVSDRSDANGNPVRGEEIDKAKENKIKQRNKRRLTT